MHLYPRLVDECPFISDVKENLGDPLHLKIPLVYELLARRAPSNPWTYSSFLAFTAVFTAAHTVDPAFVVRTQPTGED